MAEVTDIKVSNASVMVEDSRGRVIELKKPNVLAQYRLVKMLGKDAENQTYVSMMAPILYVYSIDGEIANFSSVKEMESIIQKLDDEGLKAVMEGIEQNFSMKTEVKEEIKK